MALFLDFARAKTMNLDINTLRRSLAGYDASAAYDAHTRARRWWACNSAKQCCRAHIFGMASPKRVYRDFAALDAAALARDFEGMIEAWALCERWVSCLESIAPACRDEKKEAA